MTRILYDAITPTNIPANPQMVAGYVGGNSWTWTAKSWALFPNAVKVRITCDYTQNDGHVGDCETGALTEAEAPGWVRMRRASGIDPTIYCSTSRWPAVRASFAAQGVAQPHYWVAAYPGAGPTIPVGAIAHQYSDVGGFDTSIVADFWPGVDAPAPPIEEGEMLLVFTATVVGGPSTGVNAQFVSNGMRFRWIQNSNQLGDILNGTGPVFNSGPVQSWAANAPVADVGAFGNPDDPVTATMLGLPFPASGGAPGPAGAAGPPGPPGTIPATAKVTGIVSLS